MPFTRAQFLQVFADYNAAIWPMQALLFILAVGIVALALARKRGVAIILAGLWAWCGVVYHWMYFARVNPAAWLFGLLFLAAAVLLMRGGRALEFGGAPPLRMAIGSALITYALLLYPAISYLAGHHYPETPTFGAPCPLTIFTLGLLLTARPPIPPAVALLPLVWSLFGPFAVYQFGMIEDLGLPVAALAVAAYLMRDRFAHPSGEPSHAHA